MTTFFGATLKDVGIRNKRLLNPTDKDCSTSKLVGLNLYNNYIKRCYNENKRKNRESATVSNNV